MMGIVSIENFGPPFQYLPLFFINSDYLRSELEGSSAGESFPSKVFKIFMLKYTRKIAVVKCNIIIRMKTLELDFSEKIVASGRAALITKLMYLQNQFKIFHWQTYSQAQHSAFGQAYYELSYKIDQFVEVYQGIYERLDFGGEGFFFSNFGETSFTSLIEEHVAALKTYDNYFDGQPDLLNIRDEILAALHKTQYLLTLM